ncbi:MAG: B12-binding domain-containing radical SAM protein [Acidobacteriota bacterium]
MSKIIFIEPKAPNLHIYSKFALPRLGCYLLAALMKKRGWETEIIFEETHQIDFEQLKSADIVGISTITSTAPRAYKIADRIRQLGIPVLMGGPHVTFLAEEALKHADFVIRGEGEKALSAFIDAWERDGDFSHVPNLSYKRDSKTFHNPVAKPVTDLDRIPFPDFQEYKRLKKGIAGHTIIPVLTSRGCPFDCSFCSVTGMFGKKYRFRSTENIIEELRNYNHPRNFIFFYDDNFTANRKRTRKLMEAVIREKFKFKWSTQVRADIARDESLVRLMKKAGCHTLYIGFESVNPRSLKEMKKKQTVDEITDAVKILRRYRIHVHGMFVYGFDEDDWKTVKQTVKFAKRWGLTSSQFLILTPLPGSELYEKIRKEKRILFNDWSLYDAHHVVFRPARLSLFGLQRAQIFSHKKFYSLIEMIKKFILGRWLDLGLAHYARKLNRMWRRRNRTFFKALDLLAPRKKGEQAKITIDYQQEIRL